MRDLASDPARYPQLVWAVRSSSVGNELIAVNPYRETVESYSLIDAASEIFDIAINPATGVLYGTSVDSLYTIDAFTGESALVAQTSISDVSGIGFGATGRLFGFGPADGFLEDMLVEIDITDASTTTIGPVRANRLATNGLSDIAFDPLSGDLYALGPNVYELVTIDPDTGTVTSVGDSLPRPSGLAFTAVPEPSTGLLLWAVGLTVIGSRKRS